MVFVSWIRMACLPYWSRDWLISAEMGLEAPLLVVADGEGPVAAGPQAARSEVAAATIMDAAIERQVRHAMPKV